MARFTVLLTLSCAFASCATTTDTDARERSALEAVRQHADAADCTEEPVARLMARQRALVGTVVTHSTYDVRSCDDTMTFSVECHGESAACSVSEHPRTAALPE